VQVPHGPDWMVKNCSRPERYFKTEGPGFRRRCGDREVPHGPDWNVARVAELADAYGLGPYAERLKGSTPFPRIYWFEGS
jgi:hypothetical protein